MKIKILGHLGRLGSKIVSVASKDDAIRVCDEANADLVIDVSSPEGTMQALTFCLKQKKPLLIGTTGHDEQQLKAIKQASYTIPILHARNFSLGITKVMQIIPLLLAKQQEVYVDIIEEHHHLKKDMPSGTAIELERAIQDAAPHAHITIHSIRKPLIHGKHNLIFRFGDEEISFTHEALTKEAFAKGALLASHFLINKKPGYYTMEQVYANDTNE